MNTAIIGVGRIGMYHIREFKKYSNITAIFSINNGEVNYNKIKKEYNIEVNYYDNIDNMLTNENIDIVVICSPTKTHYDYLKKCIDYNIKYIFCEKPFIYNTNINNLMSANILLEDPLVNNISVNTQWIYGINQLLPYFDKNINNINIYMEHHIDDKQIEFYTELISHMNSIVIYLLGNNEIKNIKYINKNNNEKEFHFNYNKINIIYTLIHPKSKIGFKIKINNKLFIREVDEKYNQYFLCDDNKIRIEDPFNLSIKHFINNESFLKKEDILKNIEMTDILINSL